jgi:hypothetical protein
MEHTPTPDLHGLTHNQYAYLEALLVNMSTTYWVSNSTSKHRPNRGKPAAIVTVIPTHSKPLHAENILTMLEASTPIEWGVAKQGAYLTYPGGDYRYSIMLNDWHVRKSERLATSGTTHREYLPDGDVLFIRFCVPNLTEVLETKYAGTLFLEAYKTIAYLYSNALFSGNVPKVGEDIPTLEDILSMLEGYGEYNTITYTNDGDTSTSEEAPKQYSGESGVELAYDNTSSEGKYSLRYIAGVTCYYFSVLATLFFLASFVAVFFMRGYTWLLTCGFGMLSFIFIYSTTTLLTEEEIKKL